MSVIAIFRQLQTAHEIKSVRFAFHRKYCHVFLDSTRRAPSTLIKIRNRSRKAERFRDRTMMHEHQEKLSFINVLDTRCGALRSGQFQGSANPIRVGIGREHKHLIPSKIATVSYVHLSRPIPKLLRDVVKYAAVPPAPHESDAEKGEC